MHLYFNDNIINPRIINKIIYANAKKYFLADKEKYRLITVYLKKHFIEVYNISKPCQ